MVIKSTVKHSHVVHAVWHAFRCNNPGMGFTDDAHVHHNAHTEEYLINTIGMEGTLARAQNILFMIKPIQGRKLVKVKSGLRAANRTQTFLEIPMAL